jgi:mediator of RNA polymerase II transcription subunit 24
LFSVIGRLAKESHVLNNLSFLFSNVPLKESLKSTWQRVSSLGYVDLPSLWSLRDLYRVGGSRWFAESLVDELLSVVYQDDLDKLTDTLVALMHLDLERCTLELVEHVLPAHLQSKTRMRRLTDPHGTALAKVVVSCLYACLLPSR